MVKFTLEYYLAKDEEKKKKLRGYYLSKKYNISHEEYDNILKSQNEKCAICKNVSFDNYSKQGTETSKRKLAVDHSHKTGKNRGLLCMRCNNGLGYFQDDIQILQNAIEYLKKHTDIQ